MVRKRLSFHLVAVLVAVLGAGAARADLYDAGQAYAKADYETAFRLYRELAELGQVDAQEYVASMYVGGEGVKRDNMSGYAWATIALENGGGDADLMRSIIKQLDPYMTASSRKRVDEIRAQFGREALTRALLPNIFQNANYMDREPCHLTKGETGIYPEDAWSRGIQGNAYVEFTVMPDGRARNPRVIYSVPAGVFEEAARVAILKSEFSPARTKQGLVPCTMSLMFRYVLDLESKDYPKLEVFAKETLAKAEAGDPHAQMVYGLLVSGMPQLKQNRSDAMPWFLKSAQAGVPTAQFTIGYSMLQGWGCECDEPKGLVWLHKAAAADQSDAQVVLANYLLRGDPPVEDVAKARKWLERAVDHGNRDAKFYLAALLAAGVDPASRDPQRSLVLLKEVMSDVNQDPTAYEIRAAAYAMLGKFTEAQNDQEKALRIAKKLKWETASQQARLASYQNKNPWTGDLFAF